MTDFFYMGGHGFFIWTSYLIVFAVLLYSYVIPHIQRKKILREIKTYHSKTIKKSHIEKDDA